jgi:hypothetical protein
MYLLRYTAHWSFCSSSRAPTRRVMIASSLGKMPTTSVRRLISPFEALERIDRVDLGLPTARYSVAGRFLRNRHSATRWQGSCQTMAMALASSSTPILYCAYCASTGCAPSLAGKSGTERPKERADSWPITADSPLQKRGSYLLAFPSRAPPRRCPVSHSPPENTRTSASSPNEWIARCRTETDR